MSYFTDSDNIEALALAIIPDQPTASAEVRAALAAARENMKSKLLTETGKFINAGLNDLFSTGTPAPNDGGLALQTAWKNYTA